MDDLISAATQLAEIESEETQSPDQENQESGSAGKVQDPQEYPFCHPGARCEDREAFNESQGYMDVIWLETALEGEIVNVSFKLAQIPDSFTVNRESVELNWAEYLWMIFIDVDGDPTTGYENHYNGVEYQYEISHSKLEDGEITGPFEDVFDSILYVTVDEYLGDQIDSPKFFVDYNTNIVSTSFEVPGINENSVLYMVTSDGADMRAADNLDDTWVLQELGILTF
jgi:hypothetical protein